MGPNIKQYPIILFNAVINTKSQQEGLKQSWDKFIYP